MKRLLSLLVIPVLMIVLVTPVLAQVSLPYTTDLISGRDTALDVGDLTVAIDGTITFQVDEASGRKRKGVGKWIRAGRQLRLQDVYEQIVPAHVSRIDPDQRQHLLVDQSGQLLGGVAVGQVRILDDQNRFYVGHRQS